MRLAVDRLSGIVHIAGPDIEANGQLRQRCAWCGAILADYNLARVAHVPQPDEDPAIPWRPGTWRPMSWVLVDGSFFTEIEPKPHPVDPTRTWIPESSCISIDPEITA